MGHRAVIPRVARSLADLTESYDPRPKAAGASSGLDFYTSNAAADVGAFTPQPSEIQVMEVAAFSSVHDMIHAAIISHGTTASLREIYRACELRGRIAYKRSGGSRLITHNDHWKSQIRHALYTCDRFVRAAEGADAWMVSKAYVRSGPQTTKVLVRADGAGGMERPIDTSQAMQPSPSPSRVVRTAKPPWKAAPQAPAHMTTPSPRRKRSRSTRAPAHRFSMRTMDDDDDEDDDDFEYEESELEDAESLPGDEGMAEVASDGVAYQRAHQPFAAPMQRRGELQPAGSVFLGGDESSQNDHHAKLWMRGERRAAVRPRLCPRSAVGPIPPAPTAGSSGCTLSEGERGGSEAVGPLSTARLWQALQHEPPFRPMHTFFGTPAAEATAFAADAESPAQKPYDLRPRAGVHQPPPGFGANATPEAAAAAERAASITLGPIKKRLKAAAKAAAEVEAAMSAARASVTETNSEHTGSPCSHHFSPLEPLTEPPLTRNMLRSGNGPGAFQHPSLVQAQQEGARLHGRNRVPVKLVDHVARGPAATPVHRLAPVSAAHVDYPGHFLMPVTPDPVTPFHLGVADSTGPMCPRPRAGPAPPQTMMSVLQGAASSAVQPSAPSRLATSTWLSHPTGLAGGDEGADESDDSGMGGTGRLLRSHVAPAGTAACDPAHPHHPAFQALKRARTPW